MVAGINRWTGIGNLTKDPELSRGDREDSDRCEFSIAINEGGRDRDGNEPPPTFIDCVLWGKLAEGFARNMERGRAVYVEGKVEVRTWEDKDSGQKRKAWRIKVYTFRYLDSPRDRDDRDDDRGRGRDRDDRGRRDDRDDRRRDDRDDRGRRDDGRENRGPNDRGDRGYGTKSTDFDDLPF